MITGIVQWVDKPRVANELQHSLLKGRISHFTQENGCTFTTGNSDKISLTFNSVSGLTHRPISHT